VIAHVMGLPIEESILPLVPVGAAMLSVVAIAGRAKVDRLRRRLGHRPEPRRQAEI
jgi:hypothetical protein